MDDVKEKEDKNITKSKKKEKFLIEIRWENSFVTIYLRICFTERLLYVTKFFVRFDAVYRRMKSFPDS